MLGFRVPTTSVGAKGEGAKGELRGQSVLYTRFSGPHHLCRGKGCRAKGSKGGEGKQKE